ncbi:MAG TPA: pyridoxal-phosphate dependent enzyme, partial [Polyangiaceae bacterium]
VPSMRAALDAGHPVSVSNKETIADGIAVGMVGAEPFEIARRYLDDLVTVEEEEIAEAILLLLEKEKTVVEGAGAAPLAALRQSRLPVSGKTVAVVLSGGNIDVNVLSRIIERGLEKSGRLMRVHVKLPDIPGSLARLLKIVAEHDANILEVLHDRAPARLEFGQCAVELVAETRGFDHRNQIQRAIQQDGFELDPLS